MCRMRDNVRKKTRQDKTRQDKTRQDMRGHERTREKKGKVERNLHD